MKTIAIIAAAVAVAGFFLAGTASAKTFVLDAPSSPIKVEFDDATAGLRVTLKATGAIWSSAALAEDALKASNVRQVDSLRLMADAAAGSAAALQLGLELQPASGDLVVTLGGDPMQELGRAGVLYPPALFPADGSGYAVLPGFGGYVVPTTQTQWQMPWSHARMEWFGGVDKDFESGWMYIAEPAADMQLATVRGKLAGEARLGGAFRWIGSNANPDAAPNRLSYPRRATLHFFATGGYVAQAKHFRRYAQAQGWFKSLREKAARNSQVEALVGAPIIYLWGDGRSVKMLDAMKAAGIEKALIQLSITNVDPNGAFPNQEFADGDGWSKAVRAHGYLSGIYDIYYAARTVSRGGGRGPAGGLRYSGYDYLWPSNVDEWVYRRPDGSAGPLSLISHQMSAKFALETRLPNHIQQFGLDAFFLDTVCATEPSEDYDTQYGHPATRAKDIANRIGLLDASSGHFNKLTGTEQIKSWAVPYVHWVEGMFKFGATNARGQFGAWNNSVYPQVTVDVQDGGGNLSALLTTGFQVPLWELVFHDALVSVQHWHIGHNKLLYAWDLADQFAMIRGQSPILHLVYAGEKGRVGRDIEGAVDARDGKVWDTRWTTPHVARHVVATYNNVSKWEKQVAYLEMTDHRVLADDYSVQASEFSGDGGKTGKGIVVNFGHFDGARAMAGPAWSGEIRGQKLVVPANGFVEYSW
jgi:hypothetical protein